MTNESQMNHPVHLEPSQWEFQKYKFSPDSSKSQLKNSGLCVMAGKLFGELLGKKGHGRN